MQYIKNALLAFIVFFFMGSHYAQAFSFNFGDDDDYPYWGRSYSPWVTQPAYYPRISSFGRSNMVRNRQYMMDTNDETMNQLNELLYGRYGFDRAVAIKLANKIGLSSGTALTGNFHPDAVSSFSSRTSPALWGNEDRFKANAQALQAAAKDLAKELEKQPTSEENAVFLHKRSISYSHGEPETVAVSAKIWEKFNTLANVCASCHRDFRRPSW